MGVKTHSRWKQGHPRIHSKFDVNLGYPKPYYKQSHWGWRLTQKVECWPVSRIVVRVCYPHSGEMEVSGPEVQGHSQAVDARDHVSNNNNNKTPSTITN